MTTPTFGMNHMGHTIHLSPHAQFIQHVDWAATALGPQHTWPPQLRQMLDLILADPTPSAIMWGDELTMIYNEGFVDFAGSKHPQLMGGTPIVSYAEVWEAQFAPIVKLGRETGRATRHEDVPLILERHGYPEECFVDYSFVPILGTDKTVVGFYHTAIETTTQSLSQRRTQTLIDIGNYAGVARDMKQYWNAVLKGFESNTRDIPFAIAYAFHNDSNNAASTDGSKSNHESTRSVSHRTNSVSDSGSSPSVHIPRACSLAGVMRKPVVQVPLMLNVSDDEDVLHRLVKGAIRSGELVHFSLLDENTPDFLRPTSSVEYPCQSAIIMPIRPTTRNDAEGMNAIGFVIIGLNPLREFDEDYQRHTRLWTKQLATAAASVVLLEQEMARQRHLTAQASISAAHARESEARFSRFAEMSNVAMWIVNSTGTLLYGNRAWYEQMSDDHGYEGPLSWAGCVTDDTRPTLLQAWKTLTEDKTATNIELHLKPTSSTGNTTMSETAKIGRWVLSSAFPELADDGSIKAIWGCNTDITHQKVAEGLKEQRLLDVLEAKRQSEKFIDTVSHEMRNPLSAILQCADAINSTIVEAQQPVSLDSEAIHYIVESAQTIILCAQHQQRIISDILTLSKMDSRLLTVAPAESDPVEIVKHALRLHQQEFQNADVESRIHVDRSYHALAVNNVFLDPTRLLQVLINLLTNAIKFTQFQRQREVTVRIRASIDNPAKASDQRDYFPATASRTDLHLGPDWGTGEDLFIHFSVEDTGCGLTKDEMKSLFMRFAQASPKTHVTYGGSGLGLFICKELTEMQGGRISVSSLPGRGSDFGFFIKARRVISPKKGVGLGKIETKDLEMKHNLRSRNSVDEMILDSSYTAPVNRNHPPSQNPIIGSVHDPSTLHVLIVEDNLINQKVMAQQLKKAKCVVHVANHGADALLFLQTTTFAKTCPPNATPLSIVLMDLEMPIMDGLTCVRKIRECQRAGNLTRPVPVIAVTANARSEQIAEAQEAGMDDIVTKPFRIPDLIPQMYRLIEKISA